MKIKYLKIMHNANPGEVREVTDFEANILIKTGVAEAFVEPKERNMYTEIGEKGKNIRKQEKTMRSKVKESRRRVDFD